MRLPHELIERYKSLGSKEFANQSVENYKKEKNELYKNILFTFITYIKIINNENIDNLIKHLNKIYEKSNDPLLKMNAAEVLGLYYFEKKNFKDAGKCYSIAYHTAPTDFDKCHYVLKAAECVYKIYSMEHNKIKLQENFISLISMALELKETTFAQKAKANLLYGMMLLKSDKKTSKILLLNAKNAYEEAIKINLINDNDDDYKFCLQEINKLKAETVKVEDQKAEVIDPLLQQIEEAKKRTTEMLELQEQIKINQNSMFKAHTTSNQQSLKTSMKGNSKEVSLEKINSLSPRMMKGLEMLLDFAEQTHDEVKTRNEVKAREELKSKKRVRDTTNIFSEGNKKSKTEIPLDDMSDEQQDKASLRS